MKLNGRAGKTMGFEQVAFLAWPWMGLGAAVVLFIILFATDWFRSRTDVSRWFDSAWLAWLPVPVYLCHVFEEYGAHIANGQFQLIAEFAATGMDARFGGMNPWFFPEVNVMITFIAFPVAAWIGRRNPVVGLMSYGFMLVNGLTHIGGTVAMGAGIFSNPGNVTGIFCFIPLFCWFVYASLKGRILSGKGLACAIASGVVEHLGVFSAYAVNLVLGQVATLVWVPFMAFVGVVLAWGLSKVLKLGPYASHPAACAK